MILQIHAYGTTGDVIVMTTVMMEVTKRIVVSN